MTPTFYQIVYCYYQHNDGRGNNGHYENTLAFDTMEEAAAVAKLMRRVINGTATSTEVEECFRDYHPYTGYFCSVDVYQCTRQKVALF